MNAQMDEKGGTPRAPLHPQSFQQDEGLLSKYRKYCYLMQIYNKRKAEF
jgi:hypothetical protein